MKTMISNKIYLSMAALVLVCAMTAGCSSDDNLAKIEITQPEIDNGNQTAVYTITVNLDEAGGTRALNPTTGVKTFSEDDQIALIYKDNTTGQLAKLVSNALTDADIASEGKSATFSFNSTPIPVSDSKVRYIYPASMAATTLPTDVDSDNDGTVDYTALGTQDGTVASLANVDLGIYDGTASGTVLPTSFTLVNPLTIGAFTIKNNATDDITNTINKLTISDGTNTYAVTTTTALSTFYVAMQPISDTQTVVVQATDGTTHYVKTVTDKTLAKNNITPVNVTMFAGTPASNVAAADIGKLLGADGFIYADAAAAAATGTTAEAVIAYVGKVDKYFDKFLALALRDVYTGGLPWDLASATVNTYAKNHPITIGGTTYNTSTTGDTYYDIVASDQATTSATATAQQTGWRLPSVTDWRYIFDGLGRQKAGLTLMAKHSSGSPVYSSNATPASPLGVTDEMFYCDGGNGSSLLNAINSACDNTEPELRSDAYWSSSEYSGGSDDAWRYDFYSGQFLWVSKTYYVHVRAVFAY
ncbi:MAG: hypothetical protein IJK43_00050 [Prevotella sp.]|nr:hypothetical protein [Prevotella sp.]